MHMRKIVKNDKIKIWGVDDENMPAADEQEQSDDTPSGDGARGTWEAAMGPRVGSSWTKTRLSFPPPRPARRRRHRHHHSHQHSRRRSR